jgi:hypothetical protein
MQHTVGTTNWIHIISCECFVLVGALRRTHVHDAHTLTLGIEINLIKQTPIARSYDSHMSYVSQIHTYIHTYIHTCIFTHTHTHTHTHTQDQEKHFRCVTARQQRGLGTPREIRPNNARNQTMKRLHTQSNLLRLVCFSTWIFSCACQVSLRKFGAKINACAFKCSARRHIVHTVFLWRARAACSVSNESHRRCLLFDARCTCMRGMYASFAVCMRLHRLPWRQQCVSFAEHRVSLCAHAHRHSANA